MSDRAPFREGLFSEGMGRARLTGNKCGACGRIYFPARSFCFDCSREELEPIEFGGEGTLYSYTVAHMASAHFNPPYYAGWIEVEEGVRVFAPLVVEEGKPLRIGMKMTLVIDQLWREGDKRVVGYKYRPR